MLWGAVAKITDSSDWHQHEMLELIYCVSGEGTFVTSKLRISIKPNRTILVAPNTQHHFEFDDGKYVDLKVMCVTPQDLSSFLAPNLLASVDALVEKQVSHTDYVDDADFVSTLVAKIPNEIVTQNDEGAHAIWGTLGLLLTLHSQPHLEQIQAVPSQYRSAIYNVTRWLDSHLFQVHKLDDLASRFGLSRSLLTKEFRKNTGCSITEYCNIRRLEMAGKKLTSENAAISDVAAECGFTTLSHFHRKFKAMYGITPHTLKKQLSHQQLS